jgi:hypothetical protein
MNTEPVRPLAGFGSFVGDFQDLSAIIAKIAVFLPLADLAVNFGPPWPSRIVVDCLMCLLNGLVLMYSFEFWKNGKPALVDIRTAFRVGMLLFVIALVLYSTLFAVFIVDADDQWHREVIGWNYHKHIAALVDANPSLYTPTELLERFERDPMNIWTRGTVIVARLGTLFAWLFVVSSWALILASFVALQWRHVVVPRKRRD